MRPESVVWWLVGTVVGFFLNMTLVQSANADEHFAGVNTWSRHLTTRNERYCEENPGAFYERRWADGTKGVQVGYYRNSYCKLQNANRIDDTFYAAAIYQPWTWNGVRLGGFVGPASGYRKGSVAVIGGAMATWEVSRDVAVQVIGNPAVLGLQLKMRLR